MERWSLYSVKLRLKLYLVTENLIKHSLRPLLTGSELVGMRLHFSQVPRLCCCSGLQILFSGIERK